MSNRVDDDRGENGGERGERGRGKIYVWEKRRKAKENSQIKKTEHGLKNKEIPRSSYSKNIPRNPVDFAESLCQSVKIHRRESF